MTEPAKMSPAKLALVAEEPADSLGSASWIGVDEYEPGGEFYERATKFLAVVNWDALASISSRLRDGIPCKVGDRFSIGHFNMVRRIVFDDGISWVARVKMPQLEAGSVDSETFDRVVDTLEVEVASMKFLKAKTLIPVPEVHYHSVDPTNDVGAEYILMDYIHGTVATELRVAKECAIGLFGTPDQDREFRKQMAIIQATLSSFKFDIIGSLYLDEQTPEFFIGQDNEIGKGPWTSSMDYYADLTDHALRECLRYGPPDVKTSCSFAVPILFKHLISLYGHNSPMDSPFSLMNRDFGAHNLLVDDNFEIVGVIDLHIMAAPIEVVAQYPVLTGLDRDPPGHVETIPAAIDRIERTKPKLKEYKDMVEAAEAKMEISNGLGNTAIANMMLSDAASIFQGLLRYQSYQKLSNDKWMEAYLRLLRGHVRDGEQQGS